MKISISNNNKTVTILNTLIKSGYYKGIINDAKFKLRGTYPNALQINGELNDKGKFDLSIEYHFAIIYLSTFFSLFGAILSIIYLFKGVFIPFVFFILIVIAFLLSLKFAERKNMKLFLEKFFEFEKREFEK